MYIFTTKYSEMKKNLLIPSLLMISFTLIQCTAKKAATADMPPEEIVANVKKNYTAEQMEEGKTIFESNCNKCHGLKEPESRDVAKWERVLPRMNKRANLDDEQAGKVRAYILAHAKLD